LLHELKMDLEKTNKLIVVYVDSFVMILVIKNHF
jgi:hypothetical protein